MNSQIAASGMRRRTAQVIVLCGWLAGGMAPLVTYAHHSFAMFDRDTQTTVEGVVREFQWTNPHIWIQLLVEENGKTVEYSVEAGSPNTLARRGWTSQTFKAGDHVKVTLNPLREEGRRGGNFIQAVLPDGSILTQG